MSYVSHSESTTVQEQPMESTDSSDTTSGGASNWQQASSVLGMYTVYYDLHCVCVCVVTGSDYEVAVSNLMTLGFDRESTVRALHASFNNPDRAVQYLMGVSDFDYTI